MLLGKRSSTYKWTSPRTPTLLPDRELIGICAATPNSINLPHQTTPGFTVPVIFPLQSALRHVSIGNSVTSITRLNGAPRPISFTKDWRYRRLYCKENAQVRVVGLRSISVSPVSSLLETLPL